MNIEQLNEKIKSTPALLVYFSGASCGVCKVLKPKIKEAFSTNYPNIKFLEINIEDNLELSRQFNIFAMPSILVFFDGSEFVRKERNVSVDGLIDQVKRPYSLFFE